MISDNKNVAGKFINIVALIVIMHHQASGGRWYNLEENFDQHPKDIGWEDRIVFPESGEEDLPSTEASLKGVATGTHRINEATNLALKSSNALVTDFEQIDSCKHMSSLQECMDRCKVPDCIRMSRTYNPVCGTNGVTYGNIYQLRCARTCGVNVDLHQQHACKTKSGKSEVTWSLPVLSEEEVARQRCLQDCPVTPEYNPVCGTNNVIYHNTAKLLCAQRCGIDVQFLRYAPCPYQTVSTSSTTHAPTTSNVMDIILQDCLHSCPTTSEYNPVCGTNDVTYHNIGKLECAKACGVDVNLRRSWPCGKKQPTSPSLNTPESTTPFHDYSGDIDPRFSNQ